MGLGITVRPISEPDLLSKAVDIGLDAWGSDPIEATPSHVLKAAAENGGLVLGAFIDNEMVGFSWGFIGRDYSSGKLYFYSHQTGVLNNIKYKGVGFELKKSQREWCISQGFDLIKWTYDPAQSLNAYFNVNKLGVISRTFKINYYGEIRDSINRGMPTDRLVIEWWIKTPRVEDRVERKIHGELKSIFSHLKIERVIDFDSDSMSVSGWVKKGHRYIGVVIPRSISKLRDQDPDKALRWRLILREVLDHYINRENYIVSEFFNLDDRFGMYILVNEDLDKILNNTLWWKKHNTHN